LPSTKEDPQRLVRRVAARDEAGAALPASRATIVELDEFWREADARRLEHRAAKLDSLVARPRDDLRLVLVLADAHAWAEVRGPSVHVEHVEARRWPGTGRALVSLGTLIAAIELQRPRAIVAVAGATLLTALGLAAARLRPQPLVILRWVAHTHASMSSSLAFRIGLAPRVDVVLVEDRHAARDAGRMGLARQVLAPLGEVERELDRLSEILAWARAGRRIPAGLHDRLPRP
jgi:hypothetical protein